jgi:hypothetical protein
VRTVYDPAAGTGGMLMTAMHRIRELNDKAIVNVAGQELNDETWAIAQSDLMMQDIDPARMRNGNTLTGDAFPTEKFDFILANPPFPGQWECWGLGCGGECGDPGVMWRLGRSLPERVGRGEASRGEAELIGRERALGLRPGQPFLLRPDGVPDVDVLGYFASPSFGLLSDQTQLSYAKDLRLFLSFLEGRGADGARPPSMTLWTMSSGAVAMSGTRDGCRRASSLGSGRRVSGSTCGSSVGE